MVMAKKTDQQIPDSWIGGYVTSFIIFSAITALWAFVVRGDDFYRLIPVFCFNIPATTLFYLLFMPLIGFVAGRWRYAASGGDRSYSLSKALAEGLHFTYSHLLIVLFTLAMAAEAFFGWNLDNAVREIDDRFFDIASRFAPWLAAYLAGFNLGRAAGLSRLRTRPTVSGASKTTRKHEDPKTNLSLDDRKEPRFESADLSEETPSSLRGGKGDGEVSKTARPKTPSFIGQPDFDRLR